MLERVKKKLLDRRDTATSAGLFSQRDIYDKLLRTIRDPAADSAQLDPLAQAAGLKVSFAHAALLLLTLDPPFDPAGLWVAPMDSQTVSMAHNLLRDYLLNQKLGDILTLDEEKGHFLIVLCPEADVCSTSAHMRQKLKEYLQMEASVGVLTHEHYETEHFSCQKQRWKEFMDFRFRKGREGVLCFAEKKDSAASSNPKKLSAKSFLT